MALKVGLHHCLLSLTSGLAPWRVPAGDVDAGQLPGRGNLGADSPLVAQHCRDVDLHKCCAPRNKRLAGYLM